MNCNKCGTPIIPGENTCRFCGTSNNFSKREEKHEIIGFDDIDLLDNDNIQEAEIIDFMIGEDEVSLNDGESPVIIDDLIIDSPTKEEPVQEEIIEEKVVNSVIEEPPTARIPVEDVVKTIEEEKEEEVEMEPTINLDTTAILEKVEEEKKPIKNDDNNKKKGGSLLTVLLLVLLIASLIINYFLFTGKDKIVKPNNTDNTINKALSTIVFNGYETKIPNNWTVNNNNDYTLLLDEKLQWSASVMLTNEIDYANVSKKTTQITDALGLENYLFTSDYNKTTNNKEFYIFKGKYYEYAVYVIVSPVDDDTCVIVDLKFTGEVNEDILNSLLDSISNMKKANVAPIKENFEFKNLIPQFKNIIPKES